jgi:4-amino-4-deoxy-L-arabinose transferase-like glycosyltransferase
MSSGSTTRPAAARGLLNPSARRSRFRLGELPAIAVPVAVAVAIEVVLRHLLTRPFWGDEAWRAYQIGQGVGFLHHLSTAAAPLALGWLAIENGARVLFGSTEVGLRLPMFFALPAVGAATYLLARRWLGVRASAAAAALLVVNSWVVNNALQLKSYTYEALFSVAAVALYLVLRRGDRRAAVLLSLYAGLGLTCVFSLPNLFVVGPLLALDLAESIRSRQQLAVRLAGEVLGAGLALVHYAAFIRPQSGVASSSFWAQDFPPAGFAGFARFTVRGVASFFPGMVTGSAGVTDAAPAFTLPTPARVLLGVVLAVVLIAGTATAAREAAGRSLVVAAGGAALLELLASAQHRWPFGMERVSVFLLPLLYILTAIGTVRLARLAAGRVAGYPARWRHAALGLGAVALTAAGAAAGVATIRALAQTEQMQYQPAPGSGNRAAVAVARALGTPGDLVIIRSNRTPAFWYSYQWLYYMDSYSGYRTSGAASPVIPAANTISVVYVNPATVDAFLRAHPHSPAVFLMELTGKFAARLHRQAVQTIGQFGYCATGTVSFPDTGTLTELTRSACTR